MHAGVVIRPAYQCGHTAHGGILGILKSLTHKCIILCQITNQ